MKFYQDWEGRNCAADKNKWFTATVPGNIQKDYAIANGFADWQFSDNYKQFIPLEDDHWEYRTVLSYKKNANERVFLVSRGISYEYDVLLNGEIIFSYEGMFRGFELDITDKLNASDNVITVHIYPHPKSKRGHANSRDEANESCNPPVYYGWDWNPRLLISGIWDETYIETRNEAYIGNTEVRAELSNDLSTGHVKCAYSSSLPCEITLFDAEGNVVHRGSEAEFEISSPNLWWCNGQGTPYLYRWVISNGAFEKSGYIGFRKIRLLRNAGATGPNKFPKGRYEAPITLELNGRKIFCKGSNWVNPELFWGDITEERYNELILLAKDSHMNIFRMWGGAGAPKESFYDICDREGIMIWQEFMLACNEYIGIPKYMKTLENEASAMILKFRSHPSLVFWCGGNELFNSWSGMDEQSPPLRLLNKLCYELDYERPFLYTSPLFGMSHGGYMFYDESQGGDVFQEFQHSYATAYTEFGVPAIADVEILRSIIPENELFPPKATNSWVAHHAFYAWGYNAWLSENVLQRYFAKPTCIEDMVKQSEWLQCEGYRGAFEECRRQWPHCSMAINWCYNEPWKTAAGNNLIAYPAKPRACYSYVRSAMRPTLFSARISKINWKAGETFEAEIWLLNDKPEAASGKVTVTATVGESEFNLLEWSASANANSNTRGATVRFVLPNVADADRITLRLASETDMESVYELLYTPTAQRVVNTPRQLNV